GRMSIMAGAPLGLAPLLGSVGRLAAMGAAPAILTGKASGADLSKAKSEGTVMLYSSLDAKIVDAIIKPFEDMHGIKVQFYGGGSTDVPAKVLAEADAG